MNTGAQRATGYQNASGAMTQGINNALASLYGSNSNGWF
jgi:hypothetical protein